jgi:hypothetical protein
MSRRVYHDGAWCTLLSCTECTVRGVISCECDAVTRADALIRRHGAGVVFQRSVREWLWSTYQHTLVTLAVSCRHDELARALVARGESWLVDGRCPLACPELDSPQPGVKPEWCKTLDQWVACGFNVDWSLVGGWPILADALFNSKNASTIGSLVREYGCDATIKSMVKMALNGHITLYLDRNIRDLLHARSWPPELVEGIEQIIVSHRRLTDRTQAALMCYVRTLQTRALVLAGRRHRRHWLPVELWALIFHEFVMPKSL